MTPPRPPGHTTWVFPGGHIPATSTGPEPQRTSREELSLLNAGPAPAQVELTVLHEDAEPVGPYRFEVPGRRVRVVRINDLIDPQAVPLGVPFGLVLHADVPLVVQLTRIDSSDGKVTTSMAPGYTDEG